MTCWSKAVTALPKGLRKKVKVIAPVLRESAVLDAKSFKLLSIYPFLKTKPFLVVVIVDRNFLKVRTYIFHIKNATVMNAENFSC